MEALTYYDILGVDPSASPAELKSAFRRASAANHPDAADSTDQYATKRFIAIKQAYETLSDPDARARYDASTCNALPPPFRPTTPTRVERELEQLYAAREEQLRREATKKRRRR